MAAPLYTTDSGLLFHAGKILVITVGLPARGKTHISRSLERYLRWMGIKTEVISLGDYRRKTLGGAQSLPPDYFTLGANCCCPNSLPVTTHPCSGESGEKSPETITLRKKVSDGCEKLIWDFFASGGQVVIYDANNGKREVRQRLAERFDSAGIHVIFLGKTFSSSAVIMASNFFLVGNRVGVRQQGDYREEHPQRQNIISRRQSHTRHCNLAVTLRHSPADLNAVPWMESGQSRRRLFCPHQ